jgi:Holliday junction resolvase RusA-like endonuclease
MIIQNEKYITYENQAGWFLRKPKQPIDYPVNIECRFYRKNAVRCDLTNLLEAIDDVLVKYGIIKDDAFTILQSHDGSRVYIDKDKPRTEIIIKKIRQDNL